MKTLPHENTWAGLYQYMHGFTAGLPTEDQRDMHQDMALLIVASCRRQGLEIAPGFKYVKDVLPLRVPAQRIRLRRQRSLFKDVEPWDAWYTIDPEEALDIKRKITKPMRTPRKTLDSLVGQVFGDWTVASESGHDRHGRRRWTIVCSRCGESSEAITAHLRRGSILHCTKERSERMRRAQPMGVQASLEAKALRDANSAAKREQHETTS